MLRIVGIDMALFTVLSTGSVCVCVSLHVFIRRLACVRAVLRNVVCMNLYLFTVLWAGSNNVVLLGD